MELNIWRNWKKPSFSKHSPKYSMLFFVFILLTVGIALQFYLSPIVTQRQGLDSNYYSLRHLIYVFIGIGALLIGFFVKLKTILDWSAIILIVGIVLTLLAILIGDSGNLRWINFAGLSIQPVEILKMGLIFVGAGLFYQFRNSFKDGQGQQILEFFKDKTNLLFLFLFALASFLILVFQSDFGSLAVMAIILLAMLFITGISFKFFTPLICGIVLLGLVAIFSTPYRVDRVESVFLNYEHCLAGIEGSQAQKDDWQLCQSLIAIGTGGAMGQGFNEAVQSHGYLPETSNDSIFSVFAEIFGFLGSALVVLSFLGLFFMLYRISVRLEDSLMLIVIGFLAWISSQTLINIGGVIGIIPLKGITLPFISYGGSSLISILFMMGVVLQISSYTIINRNEKRNSKTNFGRRWNRRSSNPARSLSSRSKN